MQVKVDYSLDAKKVKIEKPNIISRSYFIYYRKNIFSKWEYINKVYYDIILARYDAQNFKKEHSFPKYINKCIRIDYSPEAKKLKLEDANMIPGCYAIYYRKNIFSKWKQIEQTYASLDFAKYDAKKLKIEKYLPIYI